MAPGSSRTLGGIAVDAQGVYVTDLGNDRIQKFAPGMVSQSPSGERMAMPREFLGPAACWWIKTATFSWPTAATAASRSSRRPGAPVGQWGTWGAGPGEFRNPIGLAFDEAGKRDTSRIAITTGFRSSRPTTSR